MGLLNWLLSGYTFFAQISLYISTHFPNTESHMGFHDPSLVISGKEPVEEKESSPILKTIYSDGWLQDINFCG